MRSTLPVVIGLVAAALGCRAERMTAAAEPPHEERAPSESAASSAMSAMKWGDKIAWQSWESAQDLARAQGKSIGLVVYAEWCGRCKELAPVFSEPEVASAAADLVMVRQDQDQPSPWLQEKLGAYGGYVPRVLFVSPDGTVREDLTSGHPRYPYFYAHMVKDQLVANMRAAGAKTRAP